MTSDSMSLLKIANLNNYLMQSECTIELRFLWWKIASKDYYVLLIRVLKKYYFKNKWWIYVKWHCRILFIINCLFYIIGHNGLGRERSWSIIHIWGRSCRQIFAQTWFRPNLSRTSSCRRRWVMQYWRVLNRLMTTYFIMPYVNLINLLNFSGYEFFAKRQLVTLFSAPNYCDEFDNAGAMMSVDETLMCSFQILKVIKIFISTYDIYATFHII